MQKEDILIVIKILSVGSFCFFVVCLNLFRVQLRPRSYTEAHPILWLPNVNFLVLQ